MLHFLICEDYANSSATAGTNPGINDNDEELSSENEFNYYDSADITANNNTNKTNQSASTATGNNSSYQHLTKYYSDLQHYNNSNYDEEDDCGDSVILNDNDSNENEEDFNLDDIIKAEASNHVSAAAKKRKITFPMPRPQLNISGNTQNAHSNSSNTSNALLSNGASAPKSQFECVVCSDVAFGNRYGCWVCEGCKEFFRRQREKNTAEVSQCVNGTNKCEINVNTRSVCKRCRFDKCLKAGMKLVGKYNSGRTGLEPTVKSQIDPKLA